MTSDLDIFRSANVLIREHGDDAPIHAAQQAGRLLSEALAAVEAAVGAE